MSYPIHQLRYCIAKFAYILFVPVLATLFMLDAPCEGAGYSAIEPDSWLLVYQGSSANQSVGTEPKLGLLAFSGMALDSTGGRLFLFGGGHQDYSGNDVWIFNVATGAWAREYMPDMLNTFGVEQCRASVDNTNYPGMLMQSLRPISRHTYGSLVWVDHLSLMFAGGGSTYNEPWWIENFPSTGCYYNGPSDTWSYDPATKAWTYQGSSRLNADYLQLGYSQYDSIGKQIVTMARDSSYNVVVRIYNPDTNTWTPKVPSGSRPAWGAHNSTAYDVNNRRVYFRGSSGLAYYDIALNSWNILAPTGTAPASSNGDGMTYDSANNMIIGWGSGGMWTYNPSTNAWGASGATFKPNNQNQIFSRFNYDPSRNVVFFVQGTTSGVNVWAYRYSGSSTDPPATDPPATDPPATDPPATDPPATDPPATDPPFSLDAFTKITVREKVGVSSTNYPISIGMPIKQGDAPNGRTVSFKTEGGTILPTQYECKRTWGDGSCKHAVLSTIIPAIAASSDVVLGIGLGGSNAAGVGMTKEEMLATDIESNIVLTNFTGGCSGQGHYSGAKSTSLRSQVEKGDFSYWLSGSIATEILIHEDIMDDAGRDQLNAYYEARFYPGTKYGVRVSNSIENMEGDYRGDVYYDLTINMGNASPKQAYAKTGVAHPFNSRWRKTYWLGPEPSEVEIRYDPAYLVSTKLIPNYDTTISVSESSMEYKYSQWSAKAHDILQNGIIYIPISGAAGREDIGLLPGWCVRWLLSQDNRMREIMLNTGDLAGGFPIHWRESNAAEATIFGGVKGHIINITDRPQVWFSSPTYQYSKDKLPEALCACTWDAATDWWGMGTKDFSHMPNLTYLPYLITGERYYLDEMYHYANWAMGSISYVDPPYGRGGDDGIIPAGQQTRSIAWSLRSMAEAAAIAPDLAEQAYFEEKFANNLALDATLITTHPLRFWPQKSLFTGSNCSNILSTGVDCVNNYENDFLLASFKHTDELGYDTSAITAEHSKNLVGRTTNTNFNHFLMGSIRFPSTSTWEAAKAAYLVQPDSTNSNIWDGKYVGYMDDGNGWQYNAMGAAAMIYDEVGGPAAYQWIHANMAGGNASLRDATLQGSPTWAIVPRKSDLVGLRAPIGLTLAPLN